MLDKKQQERDKVKRALEAKQMEEAAENAGKRGGQIVVWIIRWL